MSKIDFPMLGALMMSGKPQGIWSNNSGCAAFRRARMSDMKRGDKCKIAVVCKSEVLYTVRELLR